MKILVAGGAGFIGSAVARTLAESGNEVLSIDNLCDYYSSAYKRGRLYRDGFEREDIERCAGSGSLATARSRTHHNLSFVYADICDAESMARVFEFGPEVVVNLASQPGVRYSQEHPEKCVSINIMGFFNLIENSRRSGTRRFVYASSSSVYGNSVTPPFVEKDMSVDPLSVYAASKICDEALAVAYSNSYGLSTAGVRMFSVYGPWGRPDMVPLIFTESVMEGKKIELFGGGLQTRDFTYIDDVVESLSRIVMLTATEGEHEVYNIGSGRPVRIIELLKMIEQRLGRKAVYESAPEQKAEAKLTFADSSKLLATVGYKPDTYLEKGVDEMLAWYKSQAEVPSI